MLSSVNVAGCAARASKGASAPLRCDRVGPSQAAGDTGSTESPSLTSLSSGSSGSSSSSSSSRLSLRRLARSLPRVRRGLSTSS